MVLRRRGLDVALQVVLKRRELLLKAGALAAAVRVSARAAEKYPRNLTKADIEHWMTELSNWGRWGKDDQAGTINLITAAKRKLPTSYVHAVGASKK